MLSALSSGFWAEWVWWPPGFGWDSIRSEPGQPYPLFSDMYKPILVALLLIPVRAAFEWYIARPIGILLGIPESRRRETMPPFLAALKSAVSPARPNGLVANGHSSHHKEPKSLSHQLRFAIKKSRLDKFSECTWRMTCYFMLWTYGFACIWNKSWVWNSTEMWVGYPRIPLDPELWWLYQAEAAFYWNLMISQFFDNQIQRKDFVMNFVHHVAALALIWFSWTINYVRGGALVMVIHDICDPFLELAKTGRYMGRPNVCNFFFVIFAALWYITRLGIYPYRLLYSTLVEAPSFIAFYPVYYIFNFFLLTLFVLHLLWSHMIFKIILKALSDGEAEDTRSESGSSDSED